MSTKDGDFKWKVEQAANAQLGASFLKIPQAMRAAGFMDVDFKSAAKQMQVRRGTGCYAKVDTDKRNVGHKHCHSINVASSLMPFTKIISAHPQGRLKKGCGMEPNYDPY